jgi:predicted MFS family arabinose efflux permease
MQGARRMGLLIPLLLGMPFLDELGSGIPGVAAPDIQTAFGVSYGMAAGWLQMAFGLLAIVVEPPVFLLADRYPRRRFVCGGLVVLGLLTLAGGLVPSFWLLFVVLLLWGPASGTAVSLAQATLVDALPEARERAMARWTLLGELGDLGTPLLFLLLAWVGLGWRAAFLAMGVGMLGYVLPLWRQRFPDDDRGDSEPEDHVPLREALLSALRSRRLLFWLIAAQLCVLLDEIFVAFGALYLRDHLGAGVEERSLVLGACMLGGIPGLVLAERLLRSVRPVPLLAGTAGVGVVVYFAWMAAPSLWVSALAMFAVGATAATHYPLAQAQAYRALPGRSGTVVAVSTLISPLGVAAPFLIGLVADGVGLTAALAVLALQPLGLLAMSVWALATGRS